MVDKQCDDLRLDLRIKFILLSNQVERSVAVIISGRSISAMFQQKADDFGEIGKHPKMKGCVADLNGRGRAGSPVQKQPDGFRFGGKMQGHKEE